MRNDLYDIEKGFLIILVVIGHLLVSGSFLHNVVSFHMPVFFMITGMLSHWDVEFKQFIKKRAKAYVIPYFSWCILLFLLFWIENPIKYLVRIVYGGAINTTIFTFPFWFICCLFVSSIILNYLWNFRKWVISFLIIWLICWYSFLGKKIIPPLPWSLEVVPFVLMYFFIGFYTKRIEDYVVSKWGNWLYALSCIFAILFVVAYYDGYITSIITMKSVKFECFPFDVLYPVSFYLAIKGFSKIIKSNNILRDIFLYLGKATLVIMFTHPSVFYLCTQITPQSLSHIMVGGPIHIALVTCIALMVGCGIYAYFIRKRLLSLLFLGK